MCRFLPSIMLAICAVSLGACDRIEAAQEAQAFARSAASVSEQRVRVLGDPLVGRSALPGTAFDAVPTTGSATFRGTTFFGARDTTGGDAGFVLVGDTTATLNFAAPDDGVTGTLDNFRQLQRSDISSPVSGQITLRNGRIGDDRPNSLSIGYGGQLRVEGTDFQVSGRMEGRMRGTRTNPAEGQSTVRAISAADLDTMVTGGDVSLQASITIIGEN